MRLNRRSEQLLFSTLLLPPAWVRWLQRDAEPGTSKPHFLSSLCIQSVLQIRKLHINALVLFLLIIFQRCLLIILTPRSDFSSHPPAAHFVLYSCHAHGRSKPAALWFAAVQINIFHFNHCLPGKKNTTGQAVIRVMQLHCGRSFHLLRCLLNKLALSVAAGGGNEAEGSA